MISRPPKPITPASLESAARSYLDRYSSSSSNLRRVLWRKVERTCRRCGEKPETYAELVDELVARFLSLGILDNGRFAEMRVASLRRRGDSRRMILAKLRAKGIDGELATAAIAENGADDAAAASALARRRLLGPWREQDRARHRDKDIAALSRAGFSYPVARAVIDRDPDGSNRFAAAHSPCEGADRKVVEGDPRRGRDVE